MDGSEPGDSVAAAVLSGAPIDLQARTVRYAEPPKAYLHSVTLTRIQHLPPRQDRHPVRGLALSPLADGLGRPTKGTSVGEPVDGMAIIRGFYAGPPDRVQVEGGRHRLCEQAGI
jgi:hypothetical protein